MINCAEECDLNGYPLIKGFGAKNPDIVFIGEYPGESEVKNKRPFAGKSGQLLRKVLAQLDVDLEKVYYTNTVLCRPSRGKPPKAVEIKACHSRLMAELTDLNPKMIIGLGDIPLKSLHSKGKGITKRRGIYREIELNNGKKVPFYATLSPTMVLKTPDYFNDFVFDLKRAYEVLNGKPPVLQPPYHNYLGIKTQAKFESVIKRIEEQEIIVIDLETTGFDFIDDKIRCIGVCWKEETAVIIDWDLIESNPDNFNRLKNALSKVKCSFHNASFDLAWLWYRGIRPNFYFDTMLAHYCLDERQGTHGLQRLAIRYFYAPNYEDDLKLKYNIPDNPSGDEFEATYADIPEEELYPYCGADVDYTFRLTKMFEQLIEDEQVSSVFYDILLPATEHFLELKLEGIKVDLDLIESYGKKWREDMDNLMREMRNYEGAEDLNFNSHKQVAEFLYDKLELSPFGGRPTSRMQEKRPIDNKVVAECINEMRESGEDPEAVNYWTSKKLVERLTPRSTSTYVLYWLRQQHDFPDLLIKYRETKKRYGMYYDGLKKHIWKDGRIRPQYLIWSTKTGRLTSSNPALHNLPRGDLIYELFIADEGYSVIHADYSQAEMRFMAHLSNDRRLKKALETGDIHTSVTKELFDLTDKDIETMDPFELKNKRTAAKTISFGLVFGRSAAGLGPQLGVDKKEAEEYIKKYFSAMPDLEKWLKNQQKEVAEKQELTTIFGRKRRFDFIRDKYHLSEIKRQSQNFPVQSGTNDLCLLAHMNTIKKLRKAGIDAKVRPHLHDSLYIEVPDEKLDKSVEIMIKTMKEIPFETDVSFGVELEVGKKWGKMKVVHKD